MPRWIGLKIGTGTGLRLCCICIRTGQLPRRTHRHGRPSQGGFEQRSAHTFAEMAQACVEEEKANASGKARLQGMIAALRFLRSNFFDPICGGTGLSHALPPPHPMKTSTTCCDTTWALWHYATPCDVLQVNTSRLPPHPIPLKASSPTENRSQWPPFLSMRTQTHSEPHARARRAHACTRIAPSTHCIWTAPNRARLL